MKCTKCKRDASVKLRHYNIKLCKEHFNEFIEGRVERAIKKFKMFRRDSKILIAVSGGKDSVSLWHMLKKLGYEVDALFIRAGRSGMVQKAQEIVEKNAELLGTKLHIVDATEYFEGLSTQEISIMLRRPVCSICGVVRRYLMNKFAYENGYDVVVTGHNLNDEASVLLGNNLHWQEGYLERQWPLLPKTHEKLVPKAKPLVLNYEEDIKLYATLNEIPHLEMACPFSVGATSLVYKKVLRELEEDQPGITLNFYLGFLKRKKEPKYEVENLRECEECGYPTTAQVCSFCRLRKQVEKRKNRTPA